LAHDLFLSAQKKNFSSKYFFLSYFHCKFKRLGTLFLIFSVVNTFSSKITDFLVQKLIKPKKKKIWAKTVVYKKWLQLGFSSKIEVSSSARLGSATFQLGLAQLGKSQLEMEPSQPQTVVFCNLVGVGIAPV
jgi:hypothetical protein